MIYTYTYSVTHFECLSERLPLVAHAISLAEICKINLSLSLSGSVTDILQACEAEGSMQQHDSM